MIFSSNFNAIVAIYILGLVLTVQDAAAVPGLFGKKSYKISELPNLSLNQIAEFIPSPIRVESTFKCADDVCYAQGKNSNKGVTIVCGDDKKDNPKDRTLQVYRSLSSFIPRKTISIYKGTPISVPKYFNLNNGICYIASDTCHVSLSEFKNQVSERYVRIRVIMEARLKDELMMGMLHIYGAGWFYDLKPENICLNEEDYITFSNYKNAQKLKIFTTSAKTSMFTVQSRINPLVEKFAREHLDL